MTPQQAGVFLLGIIAIALVMLAILLAKDARDRRRPPPARHEPIAKQPVRGIGA